MKQIWTPSESTEEYRYDAVAVAVVVVVVVVITFTFQFNSTQLEGGPTTLGGLNKPAAVTGSTAGVIPPAPPPGTLPSIALLVRFSIPTAH